jgi:hypothetical protein
MYAKVLKPTRKLEETLVGHERSEDNMRKYRLIRDTSRIESPGIHGVLLDDSDKEMCVTYERPWLSNKRDVSCIPNGVYKCSIHMSPSKGRVFKVHDVPNRSDILIHVGNTLKDTEGCILVGSYSYLNGCRKSVYAMGRLLIYLPDEFILEIKEK